MPSNIDAMQQEAMRRVQEMHSRTHNAVRRSSAPTLNTSSVPSQNSAPAQGAVSTANNEDPATFGSARAEAVHEVDKGFSAQNENRAPPSNTPIEAGKNLLETVFHDKERSLILLLILILANESTSPEALLALMYLVM